MSLEAKKLMLVLGTSTLVIKIRKETIEAVETAEASKDSEESKGEYPENLT